MLGIKAAIIRRYTGHRAEQVISGAIKIVVRRSRSPSIVRAAIIPGIAHAKLESNGMKALPLSPTLAISVSIKKAARAIYPDASSARMNANKIMI